MDFVEQLHQIVYTPGRKPVKPSINLARPPSLQNIRQQEITSSQIVKLPDLKLQDVSDEDFNAAKYSFAQMSQSVHAKTRNNILLIREFGI